VGGGSILHHVNRDGELSGRGNVGICPRGICQQPYDTTTARLRYEATGRVRQRIVVLFSVNSS